MSGDKFTMFYNRLIKVYRHLGRIAKRKGVTCYRVYDHDLPEFPFCIEIYESNIYVAEYQRRHGLDETEHDEWIQQCVAIISDVLNVQTQNIFLKFRQRKKGRSGQYRKTAEELSEFIVTESGLAFIVNLSDYLDTGLFLDHRLTRQMVKAAASGKRVLNLFSYTGSFSVYAAAGGALEVVTVDLSKTYLDWAKRNMGLNGFTDDIKYRFIQADILRFLPGIDHDSFDLIILDPPTFSNSKRMEDILDIQRDHSRLISDCLTVLRKGGTIYFSTNYRDFVLDKESICAFSVNDITRQTTPFDFERRQGRFCFLIKK